MADEKPPLIKPRISAAPKHGQAYWCDFWKDAHLPEMWKTRPVVVMSYRNKLHGVCLVIPMSTQPQPNNEWAFQIISPMDGQPNWAICNQPSSVATSRLSQVRGKIPRVTDAEFNGILSVLYRYLPKPFT